jgi:sugar phosphate isomerase/epimerase
MRPQVSPLLTRVSHKCPDAPPVPGKIEMLESSLNIAAADFEDRFVKEGWAAALQTGRYVSFACDLGPACEVDTTPSPNGFPRYVPRSGRWSAETYLDRGASNLAFLRRYFAGGVKVENLNYFPTGAYEMVCEPEFMADATRRLGIELLLDVGHLRISAVNMAMTPTEYLRRVSSARITEIQVSGTRVINGIVEDAHEVPGEDEYAVVAELIDTTAASSVTLTLEYYRDGDRFVEACRDLSRRFVEIARASEA